MSTTNNKMIESITDAIALKALRSGDEQSIAGVAELAGITTAALKAAYALEPELPATVKPEPPASFVPFPVDALPESLASFILKSAKSIGCDPSFIALPALAVCAAAIGNTRRIKLKNGWTEPPILWTAMIGESGTQKTPAFCLAMKPLRDIQSAAFKDHEGSRAEYETNHALYELEMKKWKNKPVGDAPIAPIEPQPARCIVADTTVEALVPVLAENPRGVLLARDELSGWIGSFDKYSGGKGGDAAAWLSLFNAESLTVDRKTGTPRTLHVEHAAVWIAGGIQPEILRRSLGLSNLENGLAARLLLAMPPRRAKRWTDAGIDPEVEAGYALLVDRLRELRPDPIGDEHEPVIVQMTVEGKLAWIRFYNNHAAEQADLSGDLAAAWSKLEGYAARLALVIHFIRRAEGDPTIGEAIDEHSITAGVRLVKWFANEAKRVYGMLGEGDDDRETRQLLDWITQRGGEVSVRELSRGPRQFRGNSDLAKHALQALADAGCGHWFYPSPGIEGGKPSPHFRLGDSGDSANTAADAIRNGGIVTVASVTTKNNNGDSTREAIQL